jgi:membrane associated rhomboid family serine protease
VALPPDRPWGAIVVVAGLAALVTIFAVAAATYSAASDVATATAGVSGVIAALVGAYFGVRGATLQRDQGGNSSTGSRQF